MKEIESDRATVIERQSECVCGVCVCVLKGDRGKNKPKESRCMGREDDWQLLRGSGEALPITLNERVKGEGEAA